MVVKKKKKASRPWCWYCEREFEDETVLIQHQKAKHFKCQGCSRKLNSPQGMFIHMAQVHKLVITKVPNAIPGRDAGDVEVYGMEGIPVDDLLKHHEGDERTINQIKHGILTSTAIAQLNASMVVNQGLTNTPVLPIGQSPSLLPPTLSPPTGTNYPPALSTPVISHPQPATQTYSPPVAIAPATGSTSITANPLPTLTALPQVNPNPFLNSSGSSKYPNTSQKSVLFYKYNDISVEEQRSKLDKYNIQLSKS